MGAAVMVVSPFAVYLSQEARHYTLPMLLIILSLMGFIQIQKDLHHRVKLSPVVGISWAIVNTLGLYTHYFFLLALVAELLTILALILGKSFHPGRLGLPENSPPALPQTGLMDSTSNSISGGDSRIAPTEIKVIRKSYQETVTWLSLGGYSLLPLLLYLPWLPTLHNHFSRPETDWFKPFEPSWVDSVTPIFQTLAGWVVMIVAFPVENQPLWIVIPSAILMLLWCGYFLLSIVPRIKAVVNNKNTRLSGLSLLLFTAIVLLEYLTIVYGLGKDITSAVRYHFIYYPGICALLGASLIIKPPNPLTKTRFSILYGIRLLKVYKNPHPEGWGYTDKACLRRLKSKIGLSQPDLVLARAGGLRPYSPTLSYGTLREQGAGAFLIVGLISSVFVVSNWVFQKPYNPAGVAQQLNLEPTVPLVVVVGYENMQEVALGLSFALELDKIRTRDLPETGWAFMNRSPSYQSVWENLGSVSGLPPSPVNLWIVAPGLRQREYPPQLGLGDRLCNLDPSQYYRLGIPYQLYRCK
jgi:hypothetical protein